MDLSHLFSCALCCARRAVAGDSVARSEQNLWEMSFPEVTLRLLGGKESTKLDWIHLSQEKKAGSEKCVAGQGWLCCLLPFLHPKKFYQAHLLVLFFLP